METETPATCSKNKIIWPFLALSSGLICHFLGGVSFAWTSVALVKLLDPNNSPIPINLRDILHISTIYVIGTLIGPFVYSMFVNILGRKWLTLIGIILHIAQWTILYFSTDVHHIYIGRIVLGFGFTFIVSVLPTYMGEISDTDSRSILGVFIALQIPFGSIYTYCVGPYVDYYDFSLINLAIPIIALLFWLFMVESPYFLVRQNRLEEAKKSLMWLRSETDEKNIENEMKAIEEFVATSPKRPCDEILREIGISCNRRALILITLLIIGSQFNGSTSIRAYFHLILHDTNTNLDVNSSVIILEVIAFAILLISFFMINRLGRKFFFLLTCGGCIVGTFVTGLYFFLVSENVFGSEASLMAILGILCIQVFNAFGGSSVPAIIVSETSTASVRPLFGAYFTICVGAMSAINMLIFEAIHLKIGIQYSFWFLTVMISIVSVILILIMPETKGKTLQEIQDILSGDDKEQIKNETQRENVNQV